MEREALLATLEAGDPVTLYEELLSMSGADLSQYVDELRQEVVGGINEPER